MFDPSRQSVSGALLMSRQLLVGALLISAVAGLVCEQDWSGAIPVVAAETPAAGTNADEVDRPKAVPVRPTEKHIKAYSGLAALAGIVIAGLALAALIILWAGRLRRQLRKPLPDCDAPIRDFWFLKPPKPTVTQSSLPDSHLPPHSGPSEKP